MPGLISCLYTLHRWEATIKRKKQRIKELTELTRILEEKTLQYIDKNELTRSCLT